MRISSPPTCKRLCCCLHLCPGRQVALQPQLSTVFEQVRLKIWTFMLVKTGTFMLAKNFLSHIRAAARAAYSTHSPGTQVSHTCTHMMRHSCSSPAFPYATLQLLLQANGPTKLFTSHHPELTQKTFRQARKAFSKATLVGLVNMHTGVVTEQMMYPSNQPGISL